MTQPITRLNLRGFAPAKKRLVRIMEDAGWTGRISAKGHAILRAPAPCTATCSVRPKDTTPRELANDLAPFRRWLVERETEEIAQDLMAANRAPITVATLVAAGVDALPVDTVRRTPPPVPAPIPAPAEPEAPVRVVSPAPREIPQPEPAPRVACDDCGRDFQSLQYLNVHRVRAHVRVSCPICEREFSPGNLPRHKRGHEAEFSSPDQMLREIYRLREEVSSWSVLAEDAEERLAALQSRVRAALEA